MSQNRYVFHPSQVVRYRFPTHINDLILDRAESDAAEAFFVVLEPGQAPPLHVHHDTEQIFYVIEGAGVLQIGTMEAYPVKPGDVVRIPVHMNHRIRCEGAQTLRYLSVDCFVGGKPTDEPTWESHVRAVCAQNGWDFNQVKR